MKHAKPPSPSTTPFSGNGGATDPLVNNGTDVTNRQNEQPLPMDPMPDTLSNAHEVLTTNCAPMMNGKPVLYQYAATVLTMDSDAFHEKLLSDGIVMNLGDACGFSCKYCYVESSMTKTDSAIIDPYNREHGTCLGFQDVVIRRVNAIKVLKSQLLYEDGTSLYPDPADNRVVYTSTLVDPAANVELLRETADACNLILEHTHWQIRILSKSSLLKRLISDEMIPCKYHDRLILGFSIGMLDDKVAKAIEVGTSLVSGRLKALHWLQDNGIRTFGMICPSLPQADYDAFSKEICEAIRVERCEHVWAEVLNVRGQSKQNTLDALQGAGFTAEAARFNSVFFDNNASANWEEYARLTFEAHTRNVPAGKLRFLQYVKEDAIDWWKVRRADGAVLIGEVATTHQLLAGGESAPHGELVALTRDDISYRDEREQTVQAAVTASIAAAKALYEIHSYKDGLLWKRDYLSFEHYFRTKLGYAKAHGYRLTDAGGFIANLNSSSLHGGDCTLPLNEGQIRPLLAVVPKANQVECWNKILETHDVSDLTGPMVEKAVKAYVRKEGLESTKKPKLRKPDVWAKAIRGVVSLQAVIQKLPNPDRFNPLIQDILVLLKGGMAVDNVIEVQTVAVESETTMDGTSAPEIPDQVPVAATSETTTPPGRKAKVSKVRKRAVKVAGVEPPPSLPAGEQQTI